MRFRSDAQRRAVFARLNNRFSRVSTGSGIADAVVNLYPERGDSSEFSGSGNKFADAVVGLWPDGDYYAPADSVDVFAKKPNYERLKDKFKGRLPDYLVSGIDFEEVYDEGLSFEDNVKKFEKDHAALLDGKFSFESDRPLHEIDKEIHELKKKLYERSGSVMQADRAEVSALVKRLDQLDAIKRKKEGNQFSLRDDIRKLVASGEFKVDPYAQAYIDALDEAETLGGDQAVRTQALYIASNLVSGNEKQDEILDMLSAIGYNKPYTKKPSVSVGLEMDEIQYERLIDSFEKYSENKFDSNNKIGLGVFKDFAAIRNIPVEKALVANDWVDDALTPEAAAAVRDAWNKVKIKGINA